VIRYIPTGAEVQHVVPAWDLRTLYATNDLSNSLTPINPDTGRRAGPNIPVADPYNMYFTPDGRHAIVVEEGRGTLAFRDPHMFRLQKALNVHCPGVDHMDFSADGSFAIASCEFSAQLVRIDLRRERVTGYLHVGGSPQDVKLSPDGRTFYVANRYLPNRQASGVQLVDAATLRLTGFIKTGLDAHGLYVSRDTRDLYVTDRGGEAITVINFATRRIVAVWRVPGTPDMGNVSSASGRSRAAIPPVTPE
jgi:DNA-binding beta-propeller fold protein YncE